ncbi:MAG TPA: ATP-binding protein [Chitinophagaceae bacterium]|nr:ATP-binding protein [Chitinophagaceae bacterium]
MHKSEELQEVVATVCQKLTELDIQTDSINLDIFKENLRDSFLWTAVPGQSYAREFHIPYTDVVMFKDIYEGLIGGKELHTKVYSREEKNDFFGYLFEHSDFRYVPEERKKLVMAAEGCAFSAAYGKNSAILATRYSKMAFSDSENDILKRFARVFEQCYIRFKDLEKSEAQSREAQIELSLERVRARAMAMHKSEELVSASDIMFQEIKTLGIDSLRVGIGIMDPVKKTIEIWSRSELSDNQSENTILGSVPTNSHPFWKGYYKKWNEKKSSFIYEMLGDDVRKFYEYNAEFLSYPERKGFNTREIVSAFYFIEGAINVISNQPLSADQCNIMERFAKVFGLTYKRFLDLQKAEAQAREAQIEVSLERVRSKTMAMHISNDLLQVINVLSEQLHLLGMQADAVSFITDPDDEGYNMWLSSPGDQFLSRIHIPRIDHKITRLFNAAIEKGDDFYSYTLKKDEKNIYFRNFFENTVLKNYPENLKQQVYDSPGLAATVAILDKINLSVSNFSAIPFSDPENNIIKRFAFVFQQSYTRFLDLQQAEAQAREAKIEASLERVRTKAMAMHKSEDLNDAVAVVFEELDKLNLGVLRCGLSVLDKEKRTGNIWVTSITDQGPAVQVSGGESFDIHPLLTGAFDAWLHREDFSYLLQGDDLTEYYKAVKGADFQLPSSQMITAESGSQKRYGFATSYEAGGLFAFRETEFPEEAKKVMRRFAGVFDLTYKRFLDIQRAEENAKDAVKQTSLDRIRADIASMRTTADLDKITPLIWNELNILGVPFIRCGVFIMDESEQLIHTFLSTPDGKALAAFHIPYSTSGNITQVISNWKQKKIYTDHWDEKAFTEFADIQVKQGALVSADDYLKTLPKGGFYLHFLPFLQGMLYVGNTDQLGEDELKLLQSVADAFSTAYARYEDFNKLEAAKQQVDKTIKDLKQTQTQLIQSEKMASLGELTAGIAHEIQNPLNFVNNFSELNKELIDEMEEEIKKGNMEDVIAIAKDLRENQEKINQHGKRADGIVKGMLQHSRSSGGQKEPTDINTLADEYFRLAYHGLRAKDKSFNATMKTDYDTTIGTVNLIPQDIGRVILNLITNAFYAVSEKKNSLSLPPSPKGERNAYSENYEPIATVSTKRVGSPLGDGGSKVEVKVADNGNGIPQKVLDKIFQPFFTTKPTGQGTGLGLSLSYDIVKAHGGEIKVQTKEGEGTEFTLILPS